MWSAPVERVAADGSRYSLVLLDTEGIDAYDQVGVFLCVCGGEYVLCAGWSLHTP
jgi:hypothetical protein